MIKSNFLDILLKVLVVLFVILIIVSGIYSTVNIVSYFKSSSGSIGNIESSDFTLEENLGVAQFNNISFNKSQTVQLNENTIAVRYLSFDSELTVKTAPCLTDLSNINNNSNLLLAFYIPSNFNDFALFIEDVKFEKLESNSCLRYVVVDNSIRLKLCNLDTLTLKLVNEEFTCVIKSEYNLESFKTTGIANYILKKYVVKITPSFEKYI